MSIFGAELSARSVAPAGLPAAGERRRPDLRVVAAPEPRSRAWMVSTFVMAVLFAIAFAVAACYTVVVANQDRLDDFDQRIANEQLRAQELRFRLAELSSPDRITKEAGELGLIVPEEVVFLERVASSAEAAGEQPASAED